MKNKTKKDILKVLGLLLGGILWIFSAPIPTDHRLLYIACIVLGSLYVFAAGFVAAAAIYE